MVSGKHSCNLPQIPNKLWRNDGLSGTVMFAGDYTENNYAYYSLITQSLTLKLKGGKKSPKTINTRT
jgi:hypothetical protein